MKNIINTWPENEIISHQKGRAHVEKLAKKLAKRKIDIMFASDVTRTKETAGILKEQLRHSTYF